MNQGAEINSNAVAPILQIRNGSKVYANVHAIEDVDFELKPGEVHALLGENGAGKSTLSKVIAGAVRLTSGKYFLDGQEMSFAEPGDALAAGVAMVYQETSLVPSMTVAQNLILGRETHFARFRQINNQAYVTLRSLNFDVDPLSLVETLSTAKRQMVEIARAVQRNARVLIFDEPTASLSPEEIQHFFVLIRRLRDRGIGVIYISHALEEALELADRITILRDGRLVATKPAADLDRDQIVRLMVGRDLKNTHYADHSTMSISLAAKELRREKILAIENLTMGTIVKNMSFSVYAGEVVGIAGLIGSGRTEAAKIVCGLLKRNFIRGGRIFLHGRAVNYRVPRQAVMDGIVYITEDRKLDGFFETMSVDDNLYLAYLTGRKGGGRLLYSTSERKRLADRLIEALSISALKRTSKVIEYSGGNQQKVVVGKALAQEPSVVFFDEPTRGVDVGAIPQIHTAIRKLAAEGKGVVVISSYLPEVLAVSDRILVARGGRIVEELSASIATEDKILSAAIR